MHGGQRHDDDDGDENQHNARAATQADEAYPRPRVPVALTPSAYILTFDRAHDADMCYGMYSRYLRWLFSRVGIPWHDAPDAGGASGFASMRDTDVPVLCFDVFANGVFADTPVDAWKPRRFVMFESEPHHNLDLCTSAPCRRRFIQTRVCAVITLNAGNLAWWRGRFPDIPVAFLPQGYCPVLTSAMADAAHDGDDDADAACKRSRGMFADVCMPGQTNSPSRVHGIERLRAAGLRVDDAHAEGIALDYTLHRAKVFVYLPIAAASHRHFATQRVLIALNKGACVVGVRSDDTETERIYDGMYTACADLDEVVATCVALVRSGGGGDAAASAAVPWRQRAAAAFARYRTQCDGEALFHRYPEAGHVLRDVCLRA